MEAPNSSTGKDIQDQLNPLHLWFSSKVATAPQVSSPESGSVEAPCGAATARLQTGATSRADVMPTAARVCLGTGTCFAAEPIAPIMRGQTVESRHPVRLLLLAHCTQVLGRLHCFPRFLRQVEVDPL